MSSASLMKRGKGGEFVLLAAPLLLDAGVCILLPCFDLAIVYALGLFRSYSVATAGPGATGTGRRLVLPKDEHVQSALPTTQCGAGRRTRTKIPAEK